MQNIKINYVKLVFCFAAVLGLIAVFTGSILASILAVMLTIGGLAKILERHLK